MKYRKSTAEKAAKKYTFFTRRDLVKLVCIAVLGLSFAISACDFRKVEAQTETNSRKENIMQTIPSTTTIPHKIPPIDAAVLPGIETATFALG